MSMYRLAVIYLANLLLLAIILSAVNILPYSALDILGTAIFLIAACFVFNFVFAKLVGTKSNTESVLITAMILSLIAGPLPIGQNIVFLFVLSAAAMGSKYMFAFRRKHIFNPAAFGVLFTALVLGDGASWWVGTIYLLPLVALQGIILMRKIDRWSVVLPFLAVYLLFIAVGGGSVLQILLYSPILFFAFIMLPEPQTSPKRQWSKVAYGAFTGIVLIVYQTYWPVPYTLEAALLTGNLFAFALYPAVRVKMTLEEKKEIGPAIFSFWFKPERKPEFAPGQFLEWTVIHKSPDSRGVRRYFTIASSPTEDKILLAARLPAGRAGGPDEPSTFKKRLSDVLPGDSVVATGPEGDFLLPKDKNKKLAFIAGGIGITPFRSMVKYMIDEKIERDIELIYAANTQDEFVFKDIFSQAEKLGLKTYYTTEHVNEDMIARQIPDYKQRTFYISGPEPMVKAVEQILSQMMVPSGNIKHDYFPGYEEI